jgi:hypothetical protein
LRRRSLNDPSPFLHFCDYLHFKNDLVIYLNKFNFPSSKDNLYHVWLKLAHWFYKYFLCILLLLLSPLREGCHPSFEQTWIPSPNDDLCKVWLKLALWFWRRRRKCKRDRQTDKGQQAIRIAHLSFQLGQVS